MKLQALPTSYSGRRFRSRVEARWAVWFDACGIPWDYEPEGYYLGTAGNYLPDFHLENAECFFEVKGAPANDLEKAKAQALSTVSGLPVIIHSGRIVQPTPRFDPEGDPPPIHMPQVIVFDTWSGERGGEGCPGFVCLCESCGGDTPYYCALLDALYGTWGGPGRCSDVRYLLERYEARRPFEASTSARFEHGESG
jgi:hypothetical protein